MFPFVRRRMYTSALPLIIVLLGVFLLARLTGDPTNLYLPESATAEQRAQFAEQNGLDQPLLTQLGDYFRGVLHLDFGTSLRTGESASEMALRAFPPLCSSRWSPCCSRWSAPWSSAAGRPTGPTRWPTGSPACCP
ncbi:hypothetical protein MLIT_48080 [Mycolicibacterium litorale]|uniref:Peptide/nickel transport system permease protein n=1 Tax=Mycolicibacterium litorale TaxID=758802 RepID=A0AAD1MX64_9MYCO|nr:hypothetical protein MLIT_48080 [Mycolicibacterium litorale]